MLTSHDDTRKTLNKIVKKLNHLIFHRILRNFYHVVNISFSIVQNDSATVIFLFSRLVLKTFRVFWREKRLTWIEPFIFIINDKKRKTPKVIIDDLPNHAPDLFHPCQNLYSSYPKAKNKKDEFRSMPLLTLYLVSKVFGCY